jgi:lipopolysaccharide transport system permease protein
MSVEFWQHQKRIIADLGVVVHLSRRELKSRYQASWLGLTWSMLDPLIMMLIFYFVFGVIFTRADQPYFVLSMLVGLMPFTYFSNAMIRAVSCMVTYTSLIKQVYCSRESFVLASIGTELFHFFFTLFALIPLYFYYGLYPNWRIIGIIPATVLLTVLLVGFGLFLSVLNVYFRDVSFLTSQAMRMLFFLSPIFYSIDQLTGLSEYGYLIYYLNPLVAIFEFYRWSLIAGHSMPPLLSLASATAVSFLALAIGAIVFYKQENSIVKIL